MERDGFSVELDAMGNVAGELNESLERIRAGVEAVNQSMQELNGKWSGPANQVFRAHFRQDYQYALQACEEMRNLISVVKEARQTYETCEDQVNSTIRSIVI